MGEQFGGRMLIALAQLVDVGGIVIGDDDRVLLHPHVTFQTTEDVLGQMGGVPVSEGRTQALAELMHDRLGHQRQGHVPVADVEVEGARPLPAQSLVEFEELFDMPPLRIMDAQIEHFRAIGCRQEGFIIEVLGCFSRALDNLIEVLGRILAPAKRLLGSGEARPTRGKLAGQQFGVLLPAGLLVGHRHQQVKGGFQANLFDQLAIEVLAIGHQQRTLADGVENGLGQLQQLRSGLGHGTGGTGAGKTDRLAGLGVQAKEGLRDFDCLEAGIIPKADHLALAGAVETMGIDGQESAGKMAAGSAQLAQSDLETLGLLHGMGGQQIVDSLVGGDKGQSVGHFKTLLTERATLTHARDAEGGFMHQLQGQTRFHVGGWATGPTTEQIPGAQAQMFRHQQPQAELIAGNLIGQQLPHVPLQALGIDRFSALFAASALGLDGGGRISA